MGVTMHKPAKAAPASQRWKYRRKRIRSHSMDALTFLQTPNTKLYPILVSKWAANNQQTEGTVVLNIRSLGLEEPLGEWYGNPLQYSCLGNPMDKRSLVAYSPWGCKESDMTDRVSNNSQVFWWPLPRPNPDPHGDQSLNVLCGLVDLAAVRDVVKCSGNSETKQTAERFDGS